MKKAKNVFDRYKLDNPAKVDIIYLKSSVRRASRTANKRIRELEKAGYLTPAMKLAFRELGRKRFQENVDKMTRNRLEYNYYVLRDFLTSKTSTIGGYLEINKSRYEKAVARGFTGTQEEFELIMQQVWTSGIEELLSSDIIYNTIIEGNVDLLDKVLGHHKKLKKGLPKGKALLEILRLRNKRKDSQKRKAERKAARKKR